MEVGRRGHARAFSGFLPAAAVVRVGDIRGRVRVIHQSQIAMLVVAFAKLTCLFPSPDVDKKHENDCIDKKP